jgi:hypothetical protein
MRRIAVCFTFVALFSLWIGCTGSDSTKPKAKGGDHDHDHAGHDHHHHGPHDGEIAEFGDHKYHVEWTHKDPDTVNLYILDKDARKEVPIEQATLTVVTKTPDGTNNYEFAAVEPVDGKSAQFEAKSADLVTVIESLTKDITAEVQSIEVGGQKYENVKLVEDEHHHHD